LRAVLVARAEGPAPAGVTSISSLAELPALLA
jgi:hypothetical protein